MKKIIATVVLCLPVSLAACEVTDGLGNKVTLEQPAKRIVALTPALTENLFAIGAGEQIVGVIKDSDYPEAAKALPIVGAYNALDRERLILLKPDLIVTWGHVFDRALSAFAAKGVPIYATNTQRIEDVAKTIEDLGCLTGHARQAKKLAQSYLKKIEKIKQARLQKKVQTVFYQLEPRSLMTVNHQSWINQAIKYCGGKNIFAGLPMANPEVGLEAVVAANPDLIITAGLDVRWHRWPQMKAVKSRHLYKINPDLISRPTTRLVKGLSDICSFIDHSRA